MTLAALRRAIDNVINFHSSAEISAAGNSNDEDFRHWNQAVFVMDVSAISGGTLTLTIEGKDEATGKYETLHTESFTSVSTIKKVISTDYDLVRVSWTITAGQTATFQVSATAKKSAGWLRTFFGTILPAALTAGGNFKTSIQEIAATYLSSGNLKISIQEIASALLSNSGLKVALTELIAGEDLTRKFIRSLAPCTATNITASTTVATGAGNLVGIIINSGAATATLKVWDNTADSGTVLLGTYTVEASPIFPKFIDCKNLAFATGCRVQIAVAALDVTVLTIGNYS